MSELKLSDERFDDGILVESDTIFNQYDKPTRVLPYKNMFQTAVTFELSDVNQIYYRQVYGIFDWLRDIGGLYGALAGFSLALIAIFQFQGPVMFTMTDLFAVPAKLGAGADAAEDQRRHETIRSL